jgi:hypothetical protein
MKHTTIFLYATVFLGLAFIVPSGASAATAYIEASRSSISVGDTAIVTVKINTEGATPNTVEGEVSLKSSSDNLVVQEFSLANSAFGLWPRTPSLSKDGHTISFVGGVPGGFSIEGATLFKIIVEAKKEGTVTISPRNFSVFANDGSGTKIAVKMEGVTLRVTPKEAGVPANNEWLAVVSGDVIPPTDFIVVPGQDVSLFEGKKFVFFSSVDNESGISHYEVSEDGAPAVRSGSTYVLKDQDGSPSLEVVAYDKAGNKKSSAYSDDASAGINWPVVVTSVAGILAIILAAKFALRKKGAK